MKVFQTSFTLDSTTRTEISDVTTQVKAAIQPFGISRGLAVINTLHTTCALFLNEFQSALVEDLRGLIEHLVPDRNGYKHDDPRVSDCERGNARAHLRAALLGRTLVLGLDHGDLTLGQFQSVIFAELDGPRRREISIQVIGE